MEAKTSEWRPGSTVCRCCFAEGCYKDISTEYFWMGKREVYSEMLSETFDVSISYSKAGGPNSNSRLICEPCIARLRDATDFKRQVQECEKTFMQHLDPGRVTLDLEDVLDNEKDVKLEQIKLEKGPSDDDFDDGHFMDDDDDDDLDDQPLTKLASKIPKKETVDIMDLLDNAKAEKRKSTSKKVSAKKSKKEIVKAAVSKTPKPEKKKKGTQRSGTSVWQMTVSERKNAALFIKLTTVRPFIFMGSTFKCFYCSAYHSEINSLFKHNCAPNISGIDVILEKYIPRGKRTIQVDISVLKCKICSDSKKYNNLNEVRVHLEIDHKQKFLPTNNGLTDYSMELKDGMFCCHICNRKFHKFNLLNSHMNVHISKVVCEICGDGFLNRHLLKTHMDLHLSNVFKCKICEEIFTKKSRLKYHTEIKHKGHRQLRTCSLCANTFKEYQSMVTHLRIVHGVLKKFSCHFCKSNFNSRTSLSLHTTKYHTERFKCYICSKCFSTNPKLRQHVLSHSGERTFLCSLCNKAYLSKATLSKHMRTHKSVNELSGYSINVKNNKFDLR